MLRMEAVQTQKTRSSNRPGFFMLAPYISLRYFSQQAVTPVTVEAR